MHLLQVLGDYVPSATSHGQNNDHLHRLERVDCQLPHFGTESALRNHSRVQRHWSDGVLSFVAGRTNFRELPRVHVSKSN